MHACVSECGIRGGPVTRGGDVQYVYGTDMEGPENDVVQCVGQMTTALRHGVLRLLMQCPEISATALVASIGQREPSSLLLALCKVAAAPRCWHDAAASISYRQSNYN